MLGLRCSLDYEPPMSGWHATPRMATLPGTLMYFCYYLCPVTVYIPSGMQICRNLGRK